jgi:hypothetical protein
MFAANQIAAVIRAHQERTSTIWVESIADIALLSQDSATLKQCFSALFYLYPTVCLAILCPILLPSPFFSRQSTRIIERLNEVKDDLAKYGMLRALQDRNEVLFYHVLSKHVRESYTHLCFKRLPSRTHF